MNKPIQFLNVFFLMITSGLVCYADPDANTQIQIKVIPMNINFEKGTIDFKLAYSGKKNILIDIENLKVFSYNISGQGGYRGGVSGRRIFHDSEKYFFILNGKKDQTDAAVTSRTITADFELIKEARWQDSVVEIDFYISGYYSIQSKKSFLLVYPLSFKFSNINSLPAWKLIDT